MIKLKTPIPVEIGNKSTGERAPLNLSTYLLVAADNRLIQNRPVEHIAYLLGTSSRTVTRCIKILSDLDLITTSKSVDKKNVVLYDSFGNEVE